MNIKLYLKNLRYYPIFILRKWNLLEKVKNKFEANTLFGEINVMNKAMNLGFYAMLGDLALVNREVGIYLGLTEADVREFARNTLHPDTCSTLIYRAKQHKK